MWFLTICASGAQEKGKLTAENIHKDTISITYKHKSPDTLSVPMSFKPFKKNAHASYYSDKFNGRKTASGSKFNNNKYTAAHRKLPFGTKLRLTNEVNGKSVIVEVTDRGPFTKSREIDITRRAFMELAHNKGSGGVSVTIEEIISPKETTKP